VLRPGIVHRLDKDTSGLLVVAKTDRAHQNLAQQIKDKSARRQYLALAEGIAKTAVFTVNQPIGRHPTDRVRMAISSKGRNAITHFSTRRSFDKLTLLDARLETGRTHQIRVHLSSVNLPIVGDLLYNRKSLGSQSARQRLGLTGQALHARYLSFTHPVTGALLEFEVALPDDFQLLLDRLENGSKI
jgi:23S rRNA pseudouridine1911/1915/1917 synthase